METLTLNKALHFYIRMKPYLPELPEDLSLLSPIDFIGKIVDNVIQAGKPKEYLEMVSVLSGIDIMILIQNSPEEVLNLYAEMLSENHIYELIIFCQKIGL